MFAGLFYNTGCGPSNDEIVAKQAGAKVAAFRAKKEAECRASLLTLAEKMVDSLLLAEAQAQLQDSLSRMRPSRPVQPPAVLPIDSLAVKPLFPGNQ